MASNLVIKAALKRTASELLDRNLTDLEAARLETIFESTTGSLTVRANETLGRVTGMNPKEIREKRASDDNADRAIRDLESLLDGK